MFHMFKTSMDLLGDADDALYTELTSMAQVYDLMYAGACGIGLLLPQSKKTKKETSDVYKQERMELLHKILSYKDCRKVDCGIIMLTCLRTLTLVLLPSECRRKYHHPHLQGLFAHKYPENGFGYVQPRGDLRDSIVPPDFRQLPELATQALQTLTREDLTTRHSLDASTNTEVATHVHQLCMQPQPPNPEILRQVVLDILTKGGHDHLLPLELEDYPSDKGLEVNNIDTPPMSPSRRIIIEMVQRMQLELQGPRAQELLNSVRVTTMPRHSAAASPVKPSPAPLGLVQCISG